MLPIAILRTGAVTSVGLNAPSTFAAMRGRINNFDETTMIDGKGKGIAGAIVDFGEDPEPLDVIGKQIEMVVRSIRECSKGLPRAEQGTIPLLLCVSEVTRPGRIKNLEQALVDGIHREFGRIFAQDSSVYAYGQASAAFALNAAFEMLDKYPLILIAGVDSYLNFATLQALHDRGRILSSDNQDGFIPGEAACCLLVGRPDAIRRIPPRYSNVDTTVQTPQASGSSLFCSGLGIHRETAAIGSTAPNRAKALADATKTALKAVQVRPDMIGLRISAQSSEDFYAKEFAMASSRASVSATPLWCLADSLGETGAAAGLLTIGWAYASGHKDYIPASHALCMLASDEGERAAVVLGFGQYQP